MLVVDSEALARHPFWEFHWEDSLAPHVLLTAVALYIAGVLCSAAGIGGGGIYVVVIMILGHLSPFEAVPLAKMAVLLGASATLLLNLRRQYGEKEVVACIEFDICRMILPAALIGSFVGVYLSSVVPEHVVRIVLTALLCFMTALVAKVAWNQRVDELEAGDYGGMIGGVQTGEHTSLVRRRSSFWTQASYGGPSADDITERNLEADNKPSPEEKDLGRPAKLDLQVVPLVLLVVILSGVMRYHMEACLDDLAGQGESQGACRHPIPSTLSFGSMEKWMASSSSQLLIHLTAGLPSMLCVAAAWIYGDAVQKTGKWGTPQLLLYQLVGLLTGILSGIVGIGGGVILAPFFLLMGMEPVVSIGTSSTCVFFTSLSTALQYILTDRVHMALAVVYASATLLASLTGTHMVHWLQDRFVGSTSLISTVLAVGLGTSATFALAQVLGEA